MSIELFRKFGLHASADALAARDAYREGKTCRTCVHLDSDPRDEPCGTCRRFEKWQGARAEQPRPNGVDVPRAAQPLPSLQTLQNVIECLRADARYVDEEGEATNRLQDLLDALRTSGVRVEHEPIGYATKTDFHAALDACPECGGAGEFESALHCEKCNVCGGTGKRTSGVAAAHPQQCNCTECQEMATRLMREAAAAAGVEGRTK